MRLESVKELKKTAPTVLARHSIRPFAMAFDSSDNLSFLPTLALGIYPSGKHDYQLAVHVNNKSDLEFIQPILSKARGEVNIQVIGNLHPQTLPVRQKYLKRPLSIGVSISHGDGIAKTGTLGCFVRKRGQSSPQPLILSNNHVLANENNAQIGAPIIQPAIWDEGNFNTDRIATLQEFVPLIPSKVNFVDAAIAKVEANTVVNLSELVGIGSLKGVYQGEIGEDEDYQELIVAKVGRTTGTTWGRINAFELDHISLDYNPELKSCIFNGIMAIEGREDNQPFSRPGDSGAIIVNQKGYAVALLFAGSDIGGKNNLGLTYAIPIDIVLKELDIELAVN